MRYLLDTCVLSEVVKPSPNSSVIDWLSQVDEFRLFLSVLTLGEIQSGISKLPSGKRQLRLQNWLDGDLSKRFSGRILPITVEIATDWGIQTGIGRAQGIALPVIDSLLAATARHHDLVLVTRNTKDFTATRISLLNPWED